MPLKRFVPFLAATILIAGPLLAHAQVDPNAGTDNYIITNVPGASTSLATPISTEARQPFPVGTTLSATDPVGDVLDRNGQPSNLHFAWVDLTGVTWTQDNRAGVWVVAMTFADAIPATPPAQAQFTVFADTDGQPADNSPATGTSGEMNAEWNLKYSAQ